MSKSPSKKTSDAGDVTPKPFGTQGRLFDFDIDGQEQGVDGARLKFSHLAFLESLAKRIGASSDQRLVIRIGGSSDTLNRSGSFDNEQLAARRSDAVQKFLQARVPAGANVAFVVKPFKQPENGPKNVRDDFERAVDVALLAPGDPEPEAPSVPGGKVVPPSGGRTGPREFPKPEFSFTCTREFEMARSRKFAVRIESAISIGVLIKPLRLIFLIRDTSNNLEAQYSLNGVNVGSIPDLINKDFKSQFRNFETDNPTRVTEFTSASITTLPFSQPTISLTYRDENGQRRSAKSDLDLAGSFNTPRVIVGVVTMDSTCGVGVRGAKKV